MVGDATYILKKQSRDFKDIHCKTGMVVGQVNEALREEQY